MLRVHSGNNLGFTEFEEDILFDKDDPDFDHDTMPSCPILLEIPTTMSLASVHPAELHSSHSSLSALTSSPDELTAWSPLPTDALEAMTIEELRDQLHCCFTCGVSWADSHVSLDCSECGGYAMERPCIKCEGECGQRWRRDLSMSHASGKARWIGECGHHSDQNTSSIAQELSMHLEKLSASNS